MRLIAGKREEKGEERGEGGAKRERRDASIII
jgi:hypothetical protein